MRSPRATRILRPVGWGPRKVPGFCRQKLKFTACSDDGIFSVFAFTHTYKPSLGRSPFVLEGTLHILKDNRGACSAPRRQAVPQPALCKGPGWL